jgi:hypothetical protein
MLLSDLGEEFNSAKGAWTSGQDTGAGGRSGSASFHADSKGLLWIFGGYNNDDNPTAMWNYNPSTNEYRWVAGSNDTSATSQNLGEMGVPSPDVYPGESYWHSSTIDSNDNIWIYGNSNGDGNTFFMFNTSSLEFTWVGGNESNVDHQTGEQGIPSPDVWPGELEGACLKADSKGNLWLYGGYDSFTVNRVWHYNVTSRLWTFIIGNSTAQTSIDYENPQWNGRWDAACTIDTDDRVWIFGGWGYGPAGQSQSDWGDLWSFNTRSMTWTLEFGNASSYQSVGQVTTFNQYSGNNYPSARYGARMVDRRDGTLMLYGGFGYTPSDYGALEDIWVFDKSSKLWKIVAGNWTAPDTLPNYENYRVGEATIGSRGYHAAASELTSRGNLIILGGETDDVCCFADIWVFDQDECAVGTHNCDTNAKCSNTLIGFNCTCNSGYSGDGISCANINECSNGTHNCGSNEQCVDTNGSFTCQSVNSPSATTPTTVSTASLIIQSSIASIFVLNIIIVSL